MKLSHSKKKKKRTEAALQSVFCKVEKFFFFRENDDDRLCQSKHFAQGRPKHLHTENETRKSSNFLYFFFFPQLLDTYKQKNSTLTFEGKGILMCIPYFCMTQFQIGNMKLLFSF